MKNDIDTNEKLQKEKLELEIKELKKPWYFNANYLRIIVTFILVAFTIIWTLTSGIFDLKNESLKNDKKLLEIDIRNFNDKKDSLVTEYNHIVDSLRTLKSILNFKELQLSENYKKQERLIVDKLLIENKKDEIINYYKSKLDSLTKIIIKNKSIEGVIPTDDKGTIPTDDTGRKK